MEKLEEQLKFIIEIDKIKEIYRHTSLFNKKGRKENDAEHSWHICMMALTLKEYSNDINIDILKVIKMLLIHDLVEIYSGDFIIYTEKEQEKLEKEKIGAEKIFSILPNEQKKEYLELWQEFEEKITSESKFASALDRFEPILQNHTNEGETWVEYSINYDKIISKNKIIKEGSEILWKYIENIIEENIEKGYIKK